MKFNGIAFVLLFVVWVLKFSLALYIFVKDWNLNRKSNQENPPKLKCYRALNLCLVIINHPMKINRIHISILI